MFEDIVVDSFNDTVLKLRWKTIKFVSSHGYNGEVSTALLKKVTIYLTGLTVMEYLDGVLKTYASADLYFIV